MEVASGSRGNRFASEPNKAKNNESRARASRTRFMVISAVMFVLCPGIRTPAQIIPGGQQASGRQNPSSPMPESESELASQRNADAELQTGTALTRKGLFREAIPHLLAARGQVANDYAATFNLALCYVATSQFKPAIGLLNDLRSSGPDRVDIENLLAQAYIGNVQPQEALASLQKAAALAPQNEKLYVFVADACMDHKEYSLGLRVVDLGLRNLPQSARLHYERAVFLALFDELDQAKSEFDLASKLAPTSEIGYLAVAHEALFEGNVAEAIRAAREGMSKGYENPALLTVLGDALIRSGVGPGQPEFSEAQTSLEKAVRQRPNDPISQIALGRIYLMAGRLEEAIAFLERARQLEPGNPSVYANLAKAYQRHGDGQSAHDALATLEKLNREQADRISSAPGDRKMGYAGRAVPEEQPSSPHP